jgi:hypothetical protein
MKNAPEEAKLQRAHDDHGDDGQKTVPACFSEPIKSRRSIGAITIGVEGLNSTGCSPSVQVRRKVEAMAKIMRARVVITRVESRPQP